MSNDFIEVTSDYEYILGQLKGNVLNMQLGFESNAWATEELYVIKKELEQAGKAFAEQQGLGMTTSVTSINGVGFSIINRKRTGTLIRSIHAEVVGNGQIDFYNNANLGNGYYAGHIEYGHRTRNGKGFVPARPFMRPALHAVAESSKGRLSSALKSYLELFATANPITMNGFNFGHASSSRNYTRRFFNQQTTGRGASSKTGLYTRGGLLKGKANMERFSRLKGDSFREKMSVHRNEGLGSFKNFFNRDTKGVVKGDIVKSTEKYGFGEKRTRQSNTNIFKNVGSGQKREIAKTGNGKGIQQKRSNTVKKKSVSENKGSVKERRENLRKNVFAMRD